MFEKRKKRETFISFRLSDEEKREVAAWAKYREMEISDFIRYAVAGEIMRLEKKYEIKDIKKEVAK